MIDGPRRTALEEMHAARLEESPPGQLIPLPTCSECGKRPVHVITDVFHLKVCEYCLIKKLKDTPPLNAYANVNRATYPRWKLSSDWKRPSRWQRLRWRIRALCRRVGAWFVEWPVVGRGG